MDSVTDNADSLEREIKQSWNKVAKQSKKAGFREGISDGRQENFQKYFDKGYREGFKNGFLIGKHKGTLTAKWLMQPQKNVSEDCLTHSKRGWCQICMNTDLLQKTTEEITQQQNTYTEKQLLDLKEKVQSNKTGY